MNLRRRPVAPKKLKNRLLTRRKYCGHRTRSYCSTKFTNIVRHSIKINEHNFLDVRCLIQKKNDKTLRNPSQEEIWRLQILKKYKSHLFAIVVPVLSAPC